MSTRNIHPFCANKYASQVPHTTVKETALDEEAEEIAIVSDDDIKCSIKGCKGNPNCLNYLGQDKWEDEGIYFRSLSFLFVDRFAQAKHCENFSKQKLDPVQTPLVELENIQWGCGCAKEDSSLLFLDPCCLEFRSHMLCKCITPSTDLCSFSETGVYDLGFTGLVP